MDELVVHLCGNCKRNCCGGSPVWPVLMPWESPKDYCGLVEKHGTLTLLKKRSNGDCIFSSNGRCGIYNKRPFECRVYPFILDFQHGDVRLVVDSRAWCRKKTDVKLRLPLLQAAARYEIPAAWADAYRRLRG